MVAREFQTGMPRCWSTRSTRNTDDEIDIPTLDGSIEGKEVLWDK
jgi:hypothetical protein